MRICKKCVAETRWYVDNSKYSRISTHQINYEFTLIRYIFCLQNYLDKSVVLNFIQLRSDYKTIKITNALKGISEQRI